MNTISLVPQTEQPITLNEQTVLFEVDTGAGENFCSQQVWEKLGKPPLNTTPHGYVRATGDSLPVLGTFKAAVTIPGQLTNDQKTLQFNVVELNLNLLGRDGILKLNLDITSLINTSYADAISHPVNTVFDTLKPDKNLQEACEKLCEDYSNLFKQELGCLRDFELEVKFKDNAKPVFCKPRRVPFAIQEHLNHAIDAGIKRGVWEKTNFNAYGTPVVPVRKALLPGQNKAKIRVCGDYSVTINPQLEDHRQLVPLPEDLMRKLGGGYSFTKVDLADAYYQIMLAPDSQRKLALSTHRGVLLQRRLLG